MSKDAVAVRVALRIRPMLPHESSVGCQTCISEVPGEPQVVAGSKDFTFDYVFGIATGQSPIFDNCVMPLLDKFFAGYNCTILAYGQTGAGKTHTMGTADTEPSSDHSNAGVIPRIIHELFSRISENNGVTYRLKATYLEILNEEVKDLLTGNICLNAIRENHDGSIVINGLREVDISSVKDLYDCLQAGSVNRAVAGHALNAQSSRSHAVFALILEQQQSDKDSYLISKFNLVDLAGSERAKRTKAEGERLKEGININKGLLALGKVISALGEPDRKTGYVPYRESKITRVLQDSLGGNSLTLMIACCSPADSNLEETVNTLRYADRARKIKNKAIINRDPKVAELLLLRNENAELKASLINNGSSADLAELAALRQQVSTLTNENEALLTQLRGSEACVTEKLTRLAEMLTETQIERDMLREKIWELQESGVISKDVLLDNSTLGTSINEATDEISADEALKADTKRREIGEQLQELSEKLDSREKYAKSLQHEDGTFALLREQYHCNVVNLNKEITELSTQRSDLENKIKELEKGSSKGSNKLLEQKNENLVTLQKQITELQNKCRDTERLLKVKKGNQEELGKLSKEIREMKKVRVDLLKNMRAENKKFQAFKSAKNKEIVQIKRFEERKRADLYKQAAAQQRTANVMKRRYDEAQNVNKRLKEQIDSQQKALSRRVGPGKSIDVKGLLKGHVELRLTKEIAREAVKMFMEQRKKLHAALQAVKSLPASDQTQADAAEINQKIKFKSQQISSLQTELMKHEQSNNKNDVFRQLTNISDCKIGLKWLSSAVVDGQLRESSLNREQEVGESEKSKLQEELAAVELNFEDSRRAADQKELEMRREFQETVRDLELQNVRLKSLRSTVPVMVKAQLSKRRDFGRRDSLASFTSNDSDAESVDEDWFDQNKDMATDMDNVGLKTPRSVKKALKRRTTRLSDRSCKCKGNCASKQCGCVKLDGPCGASCKCNVERCKNRPTLDDSELEISLHVAKRNLLSSIIDDESDKENDGDELFPVEELVGKGEMQDGRPTKFLKMSRGNST